MHGSQRNEEAESSRRLVIKLHRKHIKALSSEVSREWALRGVIILVAHYVSLQKDRRGGNDLGRRVKTNIGRAFQKHLNLIVCLTPMRGIHGEICIVCFMTILYNCNRTFLTWMMLCISSELKKTHNFVGYKKSGFCARSC